MKFVKNTDEDDAEVTEADIQALTALVKLRDKYFLLKEKLLTHC